MSRDDWKGLVTKRASAPVDLSVRMILGDGAKSATAPFLVMASDGRQWWVKAPYPRLFKAMVTEIVVGRLGALIGAPVCEVAPIHISSALLPYELRPGVPLVPGIGSATVNLDGTPVEIRQQLVRRYDDHNRVRHAGVYALVDWCIGSDLQWLLRAGAEWELHSHDHGWYLPPGGPDWTEESLTASVDDDGSIADDPSGLDEDEVRRLADAIEGVTRDQICGILDGIPSEMPVETSELECLGWFLEARAPQVVQRLRAL